MDRKKKPDMGDAFETLGRKMKQEEVTGVSRSGRVRKKSSKLMDFESPDEIDIRANRKKEKPEFSTPNMPRPLKKVAKVEVPSDDEELVDTSGYGGGVPSLKEEAFSEESDNELGYTQNDDSSLDSMDGGSELEGIDEGDLEREDNEGFQPIATDSPEDTPAQAQSLYMQEKSNKKKLVIKDGKIVGRVKAQRKDKGKTRFTAYMLWAKEIRQELMRGSPDMDFSQTSKRLGELWSTVPFNEKYIWKRRAKRLAAKGSIRQGNATISSSNTPGGHMLETGKKMKSPPRGGQTGPGGGAQRKFINKGGMSPVPVHQGGVPGGGGALHHQVMSSPSPPELKSNKQSNQAEASSNTVFKAVGTSPLDVAAHLRLLGESLTIVGERLTEHEGQIAVSGSFSVLLDSLLCALVPLLCLTQQVPELNVIPQEQLSQTMDNIAYIMPGL